MGQSGLHVGVATHDMEQTLEFYEEVLGFPARVCEMIEPATGGAIRHAFFDVGNGELFAFMECNEVTGVGDFDAGRDSSARIFGPCAADLPSPPHPRTGK